MSKVPSEQYRIEGTVAPGFESVKKLYEHNMRTLAERETQLCVYHGEEKVVDLWASVAGDNSFSPDSLINVFSSGKSLAAIAVASLVSKDLLSYDAKITEHWPEFGANGKGDLTVAELMRHEGGLAAFNVSMDPKFLFIDNIKQNKVGAIIEGHPQKYRSGGSRREYHAITRGWIINELFRRVDPAGRTVGEFLREDISGPLEVDAIVGVKEEELKRVKKVSMLGFGFQFLESLKPKFLGRRIELNIFQIILKIIRLIPAIRGGTTAGAPPPYMGMKKIEFFNDPSVVMGETPSANANCSARGLAKIAAMMSSGGQWAGKSYLSEEAWNALHADPLKAKMGELFTTNFTQGGVDFFTAPTADSTKLETAFNSGREGFYGWMGLGGSIFQWHPEYKIGFGYVPTSLNVLDLVNERGKAYQAEVLRCIEKTA
ncbi:MAG: serine hydrolase domain-containing protein [Halioglobus sp.]